jgi:hypothetical protein
LSEISSSFPLAAPVTPSTRDDNIDASGLAVRPFAQLVIIRCCPSPLHKSTKPSDDRIRYRGEHENGPSSLRCVTSGCAVIYGGVRLRNRNSSQGVVLWNPGKRLYKIRRVNMGGCLNGVSPKPIFGTSA